MRDDQGKQKRRTNIPRKRCGVEFALPTIRDGDYLSRRTICSSKSKLLKLYKHELQSGKATALDNNSIWMVRSVVHQSGSVLENSNFDLSKISF
eukprot:scaffold12769_cov141-Cylindrotheca_fusiformis.AAC.3